MKLRLCLAFVAVAFSALSSLNAALTPATQTKVDNLIITISGWAAEPVVVDAVRAHNAALPAEHAGLNQDKWRALTVLDPIVRALTKSPVGQFLKSKKDEVVTEAFLSDAAGLKVAFIAKTTNWSHAGKPKHDVPMTGKTWQGAVEVDESSGQQQLQVSVPVRDGDKVIGSLVVGLSITKLSE